MNWTPVCKINDILPNAGAAALLGETQVAIFRVNDAFYALANRDPFSGANVLSRGIVGSLNGKLVVASPIYKQHFGLEDGACLEDADVTIPSYPVRIEGDAVQVGMTAE
ncbi:nitrite reductase small subunit NirD [Spongiibacter taiwanensis]|uniref:nitrite reductase small subunit NirD n=1 Tax=Spongiibacter taiwanensis TaxID=1748242 RepID=UPI0020363879|nr:nitrite reductase small subunit NirD [Spongiibacter taiwanensis]USA44399.1 nitrite reductase small subunit NirD [Spongiibacter taiwanensis]